MYAALRDRITARVVAWARRRQGPDEPPLTLRARRLYILPTGPGLSFALLLFVMLIAGLNYTNSLALLLTFMLAAFVLVGMYECQRTLNGLELVLAQAADCHAGGEGVVELRFLNRSAQPRSARQPLRSGSGRSDLGAAAIPGPAARAAAHRAAGAREHRALRAVPLLDLAAPAAGGDRLSAAARHAAAASRWREPQLARVARRFAGGGRMDQPAPLPAGRQPAQHCLESLGTRRAADGGPVPGYGRQRAPAQFRGTGR